MLAKRRHLAKCCDVPKATGLSEEPQDVSYLRLANFEMLEVESQKQGEESEAPWQAERQKESRARK